MNHASPATHDIRIAGTALTLAAGFASRKRIGLTATNYPEALTVIRGALDAWTTFGVRYQMIEMAAEYSAEGAVLDDNAIIIGADGDPIAVVVDVKSTDAINEQTERPVIEDLVKELEKLAQATETKVELAIFVFEKPQS